MKEATALALALLFITLTCGAASTIAKAGGTQPNVAIPNSTQSATAQPTDTNPTVTQPATAQPTDTNPTVTQATSAIPNITQPTGTKLSSTQPSVSQDSLLSQPPAAPLTFDDIIALYKDGSFQKALPHLQSLDSEEAALFAGKSYFAIGQLGAARQILRTLTSSTADAIRREAVYTLSLVHFRAKNYAESLELLVSLTREPRRTAIQIDAERLYRQILNYLSPGERFTTLSLLQSPDIKADLVRSGLRWMSAPEATILEHTFLSEFPDSTTSTRWKQVIHRNAVSSTTAMVSYPPAPEGMVYQIGVLLPVFNPEDPRFAIPRNLYHGLTYAAEQFNATNSRKKVQLHFRPSSEDPDSVRTSFLDLVYAQHADVVIGPLFSGPSAIISPLAEEHEVPLLLPLANADEINTDHNYTFQLNPPFAVHGKQMARYAIQELGLDSLAIISQKQSLGEAAANAFRYEAEALGATIQYLYEEDFRAKGFDLSEFTDSFTTDSVLVDSLGYRPVNAVYAPFTGQEASTLSRLLANDVELHNKEIVILGLEEWKNTALTPWQINQLSIFYSEPFRVLQDSSFEAGLKAELAQRFGSEPDLFTYIGYDTGMYLVNTIEQAGNPVFLKELLKAMKASEGAALRIHFSGERMNQQVFITPHTDMAKSTVQPDWPDGVRDGDLDQGAGGDGVRDGDLEQGAGGDGTEDGTKDGNRGTVLENSLETEMEQNPSPEPEDPESNEAIDPAP